MGKFFVLFLLIAITTNAWSHRHHHHHHHHEYYPEHRKENSHINFVEQKSNFENIETADTSQSESLKKNEKYSEVLDSKGIPFSPRRLEKMLEKALLKIITGDLGAAEMLLLKSLNYTPEEVLAIRERELDKRRDEELRKIEESDGKKYYDENLYRDKAKHWNYNSMELEPSSRNDPDMDVSRNERKRNRYKGKASYDKDFDFDAYNRQAVIDYENLASKLELQQQSWSEPAIFDYEDESKSSEEQNPPQNIHQNFDRVMEPHVIFKIPYDDSEFDSNSGSDEKSKFIDGDALVLSKGLKHRIPSTLRHTTARNVANSFHASSLSTSSSSSSASSAATGHTPLPIVYQLRNFKGVRPDYPKNQPSFSTTEFPESIITSTIITNVTSNATLSVTDDSSSSPNDDKLSVKDADNVTSRKISEYEGLEWVGDDVYRVIPAFADSLGYDNTDESGTSDYEEQNLGSFQEGNETDTLEYQNDTPDPVKLFIANANISIENASQTNLTANQQLSRTNRDQSQKKAIEDIKSRILAITGRFNLSTNTNQVQRERLAMFSPVCHIPRNTDSEAWTDPFLMNMHFQLNLTSDDYVVAARLRLHVFPQKNVTTSDYRLSNPFDEEEDDEKKIRVSVYYYTKSLKKHRSKKRLMDSVVTPLNAGGAHLALDVRQGLRFWRPSPRNPHGNGNNHGLVVQIEDQDGRPLKPALYIQQSSCVDHDFDEKAYQRIPALFVRACHRYVRIVDDKKETYVNCRH
ncbi:PREDICTED: uncharacterized protein LOC108765592 isoform X2 [Trachymyrmex cornetzi]|uniref:uncharacterized protein LOC108765592 isoform X2 n=1 Tax=Trachymyrmex cornetzi TaxID=471704 RepID=UPI00084F6166|nr:PREDICTED: uncharacterized protein LOC108765592 isoform X2 [Trachymyrmex cornetzi]